MTKETWMNIFVILIIFYLPIYLLVGITGIAGMYSPGTRDWITPARVLLVMILMGIPFVITGYNAFY